MTLNRSIKSEMRCKQQLHTKPASR